MRRTETIEIIDAGDIRRFEITQMGAVQGERWLMRLVKVLIDAGYKTFAAAFAQRIKSKNETPDDVASSAAILEDLLVFLHDLPLEKTLPLWNELLTCCVRTDAGVRQQVDETTLDGFISDPLSLIQLKLAAARLQLADFFSPSGQEKMKAILAMLSPRQV